MTILKTRNLLIAAAILFGFSTAQAKEITGSISFNAVGEIIDEVGGDAAAYNSLDPANELAWAPGCAPGLLSCATTATLATGEILNMMGPLTQLSMPDDFKFTTGPLEANNFGTVAYKTVPGGPEAIEWILGPVADSFGVTGELHFVITSGGAADVSSNGNLDDLAGGGFFRFVEDAGQAASEYIDGMVGGTISQGYWTLTNSGSVSISGSTVPTPAALGLFGLGLLGLGILRRRKAAI